MEHKNAFEYWKNMQKEIYTGNVEIHCYNFKEAK